MQLLTDRCTGCGYCVLACPYDALQTNGWAKLIPANCTDCNLCVYACPSNCFVPEPDSPLKAYMPRVKDHYEIVIIGSGIGGLMAGAAAAQAGRSVAIFEKLGFPGGRYTELDFRGAAVTTGAWTNLGPQSHIGRFLAGLGLELDYISLEDAGLSEQYSIRFPDGRHFAGLFDLLTPQVRHAWLKAVAAGRRNRRHSSDRAGARNVDGQPRASDDDLSRMSTMAFLTQFSDDPDLLAAVEAIVATSSGLSATRVPASEYIQITLDGQRAGRQFAMPIGGVRTIIKALTRALRQAGGGLFVRSPVAQIVIEEKRAVGVRLANGRKVSSHVVIHNGGPGRFLNLVGARHLPAGYTEKLTALKGVECAALFGATREPLFSDAPIMMTPGCLRVVGVFSPTVLDPKLSRRGLPLFDAFFPTRGSDRIAELELALADMRALFPGFDDVVEWTVPMFFTGSWPGTESGQTFGQTGVNRLDPVTPIRNCYLVGMDVKGSGVAGDLIPLGVRSVLNRLRVSHTDSV